MSLQEYLNQRDPIRRPVVLVKESEIRRGVHTKATGFTSIWLKGIFNEYALKESTGRIYTMDSDGNPRSPTVFNLAIDVFNSREKSLLLPHN